MSEYSYYMLNGSNILFYKTCLFCGSPLNDNRFRETIIPANIHGFIESYDICKCCGEYFGNNVDHLALRQPPIIDALENLGYPKVEDYKQNFSYYSLDSSAGNKIEFINDGDRFRPKNAGDIRDPYTISWLLKKEHSKQPKGQKANAIFNEIDRVARELRNAKPGDITHSEVLNKGFKTKRAHGIYIDLDKIPSITPLLAKIAVFWIFYMISPTERWKIKGISELVDHARGKGELNLIRFYESPARREKTFSKYHVITIEIMETKILFAITLFGYFRWVILLNTEVPVVTPDEEGRIIEDSHLVLDFKNPASTIARARIKSRSVRSSIRIHSDSPSGRGLTVL